MKHTIMFSLICLLVFTSSVWGIEASLSFQGILRDATGGAVANGDYPLNFALYDSVTAGNLIVSVNKIVTVASGVYSVLLTGSDLSTVPFDKNYYMEVKYNNLAMLPRIQLTGAPYAMSLVGSNNKFPSNGGVGIGTLAPDFDLCIGDSDTGLDQVGDNILTIKTNNTERMRINASGNVGIGTNNPTFDLCLGDSDTGFDQVADNVLTIKTNNTERMRIDASGNVGIGTNNPTFDLCLGDTDTGLDQVSDNVLVIKTNSTERVRINALGRVGIGTSNPVRGLLDVEGVGDGQNVTYRFLNYQWPVNTWGPQTNTFSIWATGNIASNEFEAISDARIKNIIGKSNNQNDLNILKHIEITDYTFRDQITNDSGIHKKVIGQQVAMIFPQAVNTKVTDVVPDIMQKSTINNGVITLAGHSLKRGERVKLIFENEINIFEVMYVDDNTFTVSSHKTGDVFVYGREVYDFHVVDYDAIAMLNVSATQELARRLEILEQENTRLKTQMSALQEQVHQLFSLQPAKPAVNLDKAEID